MTQSQLSEEQISEFNAGYCCDCGHRGFVPGPNAGMNWHTECGNVRCRARFNLSYFAGRAQMGTRIPKVSEGGAIWPNEPRERH